VKTNATPQQPDALRAQLETSQGPVLYSDLRAHLARDAVFVVALQASLADCALAIATDNVAEVKRLLGDATLRKPTAEELEIWPKDPARSWQALVVQPFVLIQ